MSNHEVRFGGTLGEASLSTRVSCEMVNLILMGMPTDTVITILLSMLFNTIKYTAERDDDFDGAQAIEAIGKGLKDAWRLYQADGPMQ
jgi:hypothetical protein